MSLQVERRVSFNGGEWSPWADARLDLPKYQASCRTCENMRPMVYGGAFSRAGTIYIAGQDSPDAVGLVVPFEFSATTNLVLVFSDELMRPFTTGTNPTNPGGYSLAMPYAADELAELQFAQLNDQIFISHPNHAPRVLSRLSNTSWTIAKLDLEYPPLRDENITATTIDPTGVTGSVSLVASASLFNAGHVGSRWLIKHRRDEPFKELSVNAAVNATSAALMVLGAWSCSIMAGDGTGNWDVTAIVQRSTDKVTWETIRTLTASRQDQSALITGTELDPCWLRVKKVSQTGTPPTNGNWKIEAVDPDHYGLVEITGYTNATTATATVLFELGGTTATKRWAEGAWSDYRGWPRAVCIHDQSLVFGGCTAQPQHIWKSIIDDFGNFRTGADADLALIGYNANQKAHAVQWLVSRNDLLIGTAGAEGPFGTLDSSKTLGPGNSKFGGFTQIGSKHLQAVAANDAVLFVQRNGRKIWELAFAFESDGYRANDLTLLAEHVTDQPIVGIGLQKNPETVLWCVTADGLLLGLLYERNLEVAGWFRYSTAGAFESVAVVPGTGEEDEIWVTARRTIDGDTVRYVERFQPDRLRLLKDAKGDDMLANQSLVCCSDSSVIRTGSATSTITGLAHLEGAEVCVLADGAPQTNKTVTGGEITLDAEASTVIVGLPFTATLSPTYLETGDPGSTSKVAWKCISKATVHLWKTLGCQIGTTGSETWENLEFTAQGSLMDQAQPLFSGIKDARVTSSSERQATVIVRQTQPLPLNLLSLHVFHEMAATS